MKNRIASPHRVVHVEDDARTLGRHVEQVHLRTDEEGEVPVQEMFTVKTAPSFARVLLPDHELQQPADDGESRNCLRQPLLLPLGRRPSPG